MKLEEDSKRKMADEHKKGLTSRLLSSIACCCDNRTSNQDVEYVIDGRKSSDEQPEVEEGVEEEEEEEEEGVDGEEGDGGYDNAACTTGGEAAEVDMVSALYHRIEARRSNSISVPPLIDWRAVEFWTTAARRQDGGHQSPKDTLLLQPPPSLDARRWSSSSSCEAHGLRPQLYEEKEGKEKEDTDEEEEEPLTDDQKLHRFRLGEIRFCAHYEPGGRRLLVNVMSGRRLTGSDSYVRACLLPDRKSGQRTPVKRGSRNPAFEHTFAFDVSSQAEARRRTLQLKVGDMDGRGIGQVLQTLAGLPLDRGRPIWKPLVPCEKEQDDLGELFVSLNYLPSAGRLNVDVVKAKQLLQTDPGNAFFVRVSLVQEQQKPPTKSKKTTAKKDTPDPEYDESFSFRLVQSSLADASLVLSVCCWDRGAREEALVGRVVLSHFASGPNEKAHWSSILAAHRSPVARWHSLRSRRECDRHSPASHLVP